MEEWIKNLTSNDILIVSSTEKETLLDLLAKEKYLLKFKLYTFNDFRNLISYENNLELALELKKKLNISLDLATIYLNNLYYIQEDKEYDNKRLNDLKQIKIDWKDKLNISCHHYNFLKDKTIHAYNLENLKKEITVLCNSINKTCDFIDKNEINKDITTPVYQFESLDKEIDYIAYKISSLIEQGISTNQIKICIPSNEFYFTCNRIFNMYGLPLENLFNPLLKDVPFFNKFLKLLNEFDNLDTILEKLNEEYNQTKNILLYKALYDAINALPYNDDINDLRILADYYFKHNSYYDSPIKNAIEVINYNQFVDKNDYIFIMGLNQGNIPRSFKDEDYLSDKEKEILNISTSLDKNKEDKENFISFIKNHDNVFLSFHEKANNQATYQSFLIKELKLTIKTIEKDYSVSYCKLQDELDLARYYDIGRLHGETYTTLNNNYKIDYNQYNNQFKVDSDNFKKAIQELNPRLSYSSLSTFYECPFHYYLTYILHVDSAKPTFVMDVGNLFHYVLSKQYEKDFDFEKEYNDYFTNVKPKELLPKEKFFLAKLKQELIDLMDYNNRMLSHTKLKEILCEKNITVHKNDTVRLNLTGFLDKIMVYNENDTTYVAVIDFKTGNPEFDITKLEFGLSMQLPVYLYLIHNSDLFKNVVVLGLYLQKIINSKPKAYSGTSKEDKDKSFRLQGYSLKNQELISLLDDSYTSSIMISGLRTIKDGSFHSNSKVLDQAKMDETLQKVEEKLSKAANLILNGEFLVQPKTINNINESCNHCEHANVCYVRANNMVYRNTNEFNKKGGDDNG